MSIAKPFEVSGFSLIYIVPFEDVWIILQNGRKRRLTYSLAQAVAEAIRMAREIHFVGVRTEVVFSDGRRSATLWRDGGLVSEAPSLDAECLQDRRWAA